MDAAYDSVLAQLDALTNANAASAPQSASSSSHTKSISNLYHPVPLRQPVLGLSSALPKTGLFTGEVARLSTLSERTERSSNSSDNGLSPVAPTSYRSHTRSESAAAIANKYPLPPSPSKKAPAFETLQATPKKASDLIRMFESRSTPTKGELPPIPPPQSELSPSCILPESTLPAPSLAPKPDIGSVTIRAERPVGVNPQAYTPAPIHPPKVPLPLSQVRTMIASWRTRSGSPSPETGIIKEGSIRLLRSGDKGWNVSIRRRKKNEQQQQLGGQQMSEDPADTDMNEQMTGPHDKAQPQTDTDGNHRDYDQSPTTSRSFRSSCKVPLEPKQFTGEVCCTSEANEANFH